MIRLDDEWCIDDVLSFMPIPIKSLQSVPFPASFVFGELEVSKPGGKKGIKKSNTSKQSEDDTDTISAIARRIAADLPGYSSSNEPNTNEDAVEESRLMQEDAVSSKDIKSISICAKMEILFVEARIGEGSSKVNKTKVTLADLTKYNQELVTGKESNEEILRKYIRHECIYRMMEGGLLSKENSLWNYLQHFAGDRTQQILRLNDLVEVEDQLNSSPMSVSYEANFLRDCFSDEGE